MKDYFEFIASLPKLRQKQIKHAVFKNLAANFSEITTISKIEREGYESEFKIVPFELIKEEKSNDGSTKWLFRAEDGAEFETVLMRFRDGRNSVCVSSQVGCPVGCLFCATGKLGFKRNLTAWEIISQALFAARYLKSDDNLAIRGDTESKYCSRLEAENSHDFDANFSLSPRLIGAGSKNRSTSHVTNIVFMGMGEPLLNLDRVLLAFQELTDPESFGLGDRHITVSTCGPIEQLKKFISKNLTVRLAISLHSANQNIRAKLMPIAAKNPLKELFKVLDEFVRKTNKRITYEYVMLKGVNDSARDAKELAELLKDRLAFVNLIKFNFVPGLQYQPSAQGEINTFMKILREHDIEVTQRVSLGEEISGACGQLAAGRNQQ